MSIHEHWHITVDTPVGQQSGYLELSVNQAGCTGRLYSEAGELILQNGTAQDNELSWELQLSRPIPMTIECQAGFMARPFEALQWLQHSATSLLLGREESASAPYGRPNRQKALRGEI